MEESLLLAVFISDPLSPYLFILCTEAFSSMLQKVERMGSLIGVPIARGRIRFNHLFFRR
jgi:hypothetical protein